MPEHVSGVEQTIFLDAVGIDLQTEPVLSGREAVQKCQVIGAWGLWCNLVRPRFGASFQLGSYVRLCMVDSDRGGLGELGRVNRQGHNRFLVREFRKALGISHGLLR